jgi:hypothetical protein
LPKNRYIFTELRSAKLKELKLSNGIIPHAGALLPCCLRPRYSLKMMLTPLSQKWLQRNHKFGRFQDLIKQSFQYFSKVSVSK